MRPAPSMPPPSPPFYTVVTPTFNRAHTLHRVFESLQTQTFRDFEWLVVDDGSTDGTAALIEKWKGLANFPVTYLHQANQGKHVATNRAVAAAKGEFICVLDSDDSCEPTALARMVAVWRSIPEGRRAGFSGVTGLCADPSGQVVGDRFPDAPLDSTPVELIFRYRVHGEKWGAIRADVMRQFPFPEIKDTPFVPEGIVWDEIGRHYQTRFVNEIWRTYFQDESAGSDQLTRATNFRRIAPGMAFSLATMLSGQMQWFLHSPSRFFRAAVNLTRFTLHTGKPVCTQWRAIADRRARVLLVSMLPVGYFAYWRDRVRQ